MLFNQNLSQELGWLFFFVVLFSGTFFVFHHFSTAAIFRINYCANQERKLDKDAKRAGKRTYKVTRFANYFEAISVIITVTMAICAIILSFRKIRQKFFCTDISYQKIFQDNNNKEELAKLLIFYRLDDVSDAQDLSQNSSYKYLCVPQMGGPLIPSQQYLHNINKIVNDQNQLKELFLILLTITDEKVNFFYLMNLDVIRSCLECSATMSTIINGIYYTTCQFLDIIIDEVGALIHYENRKYNDKNYYINFDALKKRINEKVQNNKYTTTHEYIGCCSGINFLKDFISIKNRFDKILKKPKSQKAIDNNIETHKSSNKLNESDQIGMKQNNQIEAK